MGQGTQDLINPLFGNSDIKASFWIKRHTGRSVFTIATFELSRFIGNPEKSDDEVFQVVKEYAGNVLGIDLDEVLHVERYSFPDGRQDWYGAYGIWTPFQGQDNLWFNGEAIAGSGVPTITAFTKFLVDQYF